MSHNRFPRAGGDPVDNNKVAHCAASYFLVRTPAFAGGAAVN